MNQDRCRATAIGHKTEQLLRTHHTLKVVGTARRGIYLQSVWNQILYLSCEPFRGPLTINLRDVPNSFNSVQSGEMINITDQVLEFPKSNLGIEITRPLVWKPGPPPEYCHTPTDQLQSVIEKARNIQKDGRYLALLDFPSPKSTHLPSELAGIEEHMPKIVKSLAEGNSAEIFSDMHHILGIGPGLTPIGDDLLLGILLAVKRTKTYQRWTDDQIQFEHNFINAAALKTTRISWSLLQCALEGTADERLIRVLDSLIAGRVIPDQDLEALLDWGSSSGIGVLAGMLLVLTTRD